ncbi:MAG: hypothetical protein WDZ35_13100 [Crocinitomicaceae bacterium]
MYKIKNHTNNIKSYVSESGFAIKEGMIFNLNQNSTVLNEIVKQTEIHSFGENYIISNDIRGNSKIINICDFALDERFKINVIEYPYFEFYTQQTPRIYGVYDYENDRAFYETTDWIGRDIVGTNIFSKDKGLITCRTIFSPEILWHFNLSDLGGDKNLSNTEYSYEVKHFIGITDNKLIVQLSNATFLFLDINSGNLTHKVNLIDSFPTPPVLYKDDIKSHLVGNQLYWLNNQRLLRIDLSSFHVTIIKDYFEEPRESQFRFMSSTYYDEKIYFVADFGWQYVTPSYIGVMDANTGDLLWHDQLENTGGLPEAPQVTEDKLYIRTNKGVLHIFEKE